jgi:hypothetical protein
MFKPLELTRLQAAQVLADIGHHIEETVIHDMWEETGGINHKNINKIFHESWDHLCDKIIADEDLTVYLTLIGYKLPAVTQPYPTRAQVTEVCNYYTNLGDLVRAAYRTLDA